MTAKGTIGWRAALEDELDIWRTRRSMALFWVRDDDAVARTPALEKLLGLCEAHGAPLGLAVIPSLIERSLPPFAAAAGRALTPLCHGFAHVDHEQGRGPPSEFGPSRAPATARADAAAGLVAFRAVFPAAPAVFVPPFNAMTDDFAAALGEIGFGAISGAPSLGAVRMARLAARIPSAVAAISPVSASARSLEPAARWMRSKPGQTLPRLDAHVDLIDWRTRSARPSGAVHDDIIGQLRLRRWGLIPVSMPIGLLLHHLVHDEAIWSLVEQLLAVTASHSAARFVSVLEALELASTSAAAGATHS